MSMIGYLLLRVSNEQLEAFKTNSNLLESFIDEEPESENRNMVDLINHGRTNFMLTGKSSLKSWKKVNSPLGMVIFSGQVIDEEQDLIWTHIM